MGNHTLNLGESGEWAGLWWLPEAPENQIPGVLRYDGLGNLKLSLIGAFEDRIMSHPAPGVTAYSGATRRWDVIHGAAKHRQITLLNTVPKSTKRAFGAAVSSPESQEITAAVAIIGVHVSGADDEAFSMVEVSIEDLNVWATSPVFAMSFGSADGNLDGSGSISINPAKPQSVDSDGTEYRLVHTNTLPFMDEQKGGTIGRITDTVSICVKPSKPFGLNSGLKSARLIQDLIALAMHRPAGLIWLQFEVSGTESYQLDGHPLPRRRADVIFSPAAIGKHSENIVDYHDALFTCNDIPFETVIPLWCNVHARLQVATNMALSLHYAPPQFVENSLLTAVGAAEVMHRSLKIDKTPIPDAEFTTMRDAMLKQVPDKHRKRFKAAIRNDPTLRDRLHGLAGRVDHDAITALVPDISYWAKRATRARNDLAHQGRTLDHSFEELIAIVAVTTAVTILNVLCELGLSAERQREIVQNNPIFRRASQLARESLVAPKLE